MSNRPYPSARRARRQLDRHHSATIDPVAGILHGIGIVDELPAWQHRVLANAFGGVTVAEASSNVTVNVRKAGISTGVRSASVDEDNAVTRNGHSADVCPARVDVTLVADPYPRYAHGRCDPKPDGTPQ